MASKLIESFSRKNSSQQREILALRREGSSDSSATTFADLEADLRLSAAVGQALVEEKHELEKKLNASERVNEKLLDRLAGTVKDNDQLQKRLEDAVGNLEQAESNNRALLVTLENDRKHMSRLSADSARLSMTASQFKATTTALDDARQEALFEQKRATIAESRADKLDTRMRKAIADLEEIRQDKVLRTRRSSKTLAHLKSQLNEKKAYLATTVDNPEAAELLQLVETLVSENEILRSASAELSHMLDISRDEMEKQRLLNAEKVMTVESAHGFDAGGYMDSNGLLSSTNTRGLFDFDISNPNSPNSTQPTSFSRSWAPSSTLGNSMDYHRGKNGELTSTDEALARRASLRRTEMTLTGGSVANAAASGIVPIGRRRRPLSMNLDTARRVSNERDLEAHGSLPVSPMMDVYSPSTRTSSAFSDAEDTVHIRSRHPRPLSLVAGGSLFTQVVAEEPSTPNRPRHPPYSPSLVSIPALDRQDLNRERHLSPTRITGAVTPLIVDENAFHSPIEIVETTVDLNHSTTSRPPSVSTSEFSGAEKREFGFTSLASGSIVDQSTPAGAIEQRSAALGKLIEYTTKILMRLQAADIASQEKRLKKQKLPGDVRHLAQANLKEVVHDIEGLRSHFRRVLELERSTSPILTSDQVNESLIVRRDFVNLVKLFRDLLFETSRLRSIVNRVQMEPSLANELKDLDAENALEAEVPPAKSNQSESGVGAVAMVARLLLIGGESGSESTLNPANSEGARRLSHRASMRPIGRISSATVNVAFDSGIGRTVMVEGEEETRATSSLNPSSTPLPRRRSGKRELNSIFAGALAPTSSPWTIVPSVTTSATTSAYPAPTRSLNPFSRLMGYRPTLSNTTNSLLDSFQHARGSDGPVEPTLLERTLHKRGLSDSSIRSTFVTHANPSHRIVSAATLALSSEVSIVNSVQPVIYQNSEEDMVKQQLTDLTISRKSSINQLRARPSQGQLRSDSHSPKSIAPSVPPLPIELPQPISMSISPRVPSHLHPTASTSLAPIPLETSVSASTSVVAGSMFGSFASWVSPLGRAVAVEQEDPHLISSTDRQGKRSSSLGRSLYAKKAGES